MISVIVPLYNEEECIRRSIDSVVNQTFASFEIIIVDDGSTDKSVEVIKEIKDPRIRVVRQDNAGVSAARNRGAQEARYHLLAFLDADDEWLPYHLETMIDLAGKYPKCSVFSTNYKIIDSNGNESLPVNSSLILSSGEHDTILANYFEVASQTAPPLCSSSVLLRRNALREIGGFPPGITAGEDLLVWAKLACSFSIAYSSRVTAHYHFLPYREWVLFSRKYDPGDYVGKSLGELRRNCRKTLAGMDKYLMRWHRMRLINYMKLGDTPNAYAAIRAMQKEGNVPLSTYLFLLAAFLPSSLRRYLLIKWAAYREQRTRK